MRQAVKDRYFYLLYVHYVKDFEKHWGPEGKRGRVQTPERGFLGAATTPKKTSDRSNPSARANDTLQIDILSCGARNFEITLKLHSQSPTDQPTRED